MIFPKLLLLFLIPIVLSQDQEFINPKTIKNVREIKRNLTHTSLIGKWKLDEDSNFVINKKIEMTNEVLNQRKHNNQKISFFTSLNDIRQAEAFFDSQKKGSEPTNLYIQLYDGKYYSNDTVALQIDLTTMNFSRKEDGTLNLWVNNNTIIVVCMLIRNKVPIAKISVHATIQISSNIKQNGKVDENSLFNIKFKSNTFSFYAELQHIKQEYDMITWVQALYTVLFLISVVACKPKKSVYNISQWMILQAFAFTIAIGWIFLRLSLQKIDTKLRFIGFSAFINIVLAFFFLRNYEEVVFNSFKKPYQKVLALLAILAYFILCFLFYQSIKFWIFQAFCLLVSQINYSYSIGGRGGLSLTLVMTLFFMRFPYFYYRFNCPQITRQPLNNHLFSIFLIVNATLLAFIVVQRYFGSRFMIPKELIPDYFDYFQRYPRGSKELEEACPICLLELNKQSPLIDQPQKQDENSDEEEDFEEGEIQPKQESIGTISNNPQNIVVMNTPCNHKYHTACLQQWMQKRLICPSCRTALPPSQKQRDDSYCC